jgi:hypothetical protein
MSDLESRVRKLERHNTVLAVVSAVAILAAATAWLAGPATPPALAQTKGKVDEVFAGDVECDRLVVNGQVLLKDKTTGNTISLIANPSKDPKKPGQPTVFLKSKTGNIIIEPNRIGMTEGKVTLTIETDPKTGAFRVIGTDKDGKESIKIP